MPVARISDGRQRAQPSREQRIPQQRLAKVVGGVPEGDDVGAQTRADFIHCPPAIAAAQVAAMARLLFQQPQRRLIAIVSPFHAALLQVLAQRLDGPQEFALFHGEGAHREVDGRALGQQQQRFQQRYGVLAARERHGHPVAVANHLEAVDGLSHLAQQCLFQFHVV